MGAMGEAFAAYAQPLLDSSRGSMAQAEKALALAQICWNLALLPAEARDEALTKMRPTLKMEDDEYEDFRKSVIVPMILRHHEMFPDMHRRQPPRQPMSQSRGTAPMRTEGHRITARNAPCPCNSGRKYKHCCGR